MPILFYAWWVVSFGSGSDAAYANDPLLAEHAIVVTHNYRLGQLGLFAHPKLTEEDRIKRRSGSSGNQALFDTLLALQWVNYNAHALGGRSENITLFGESAGGLTTCALLASPLANGLFSGAIVQSAGCFWVTTPLSQTEAGDESGENAGRFADKLNCTDNDELACLRNKVQQTL